MSSEWGVDQTISDFLKSHGGSIKTGPFGTTLKASEYTEIGVPLISVREIGHGNFHIDSRTPRVSKKVLDRLPEYVLEEGDIVFARKGGIERCALIKKAQSGWFLGSDGIRLRPPKACDPRFLAYALQTQMVKDWLVQNSTGSTMASLNQSTIGRLPIVMPNLRDQRSVADSLECLDDRIALLRETNATLEAIAQALFKSWFVDFDPVYAKQQGIAPAGMDDATAALFPDGFSAEGGLPNGWKMCPVREVVEGIYDGPHATPPEADDGPVFLGIKNLTGTMLDMSDIRHIAESDWQQWTRRVLPRAGDIVFSYEATLGYFALIPPNIRCCLGRRLALIRPAIKDGAGHFWFHQFVAEPFTRLLEKHTIQGATVNRIALKEFPSYAVLNPPLAVQLAFDRIVAPLWSRIHENQAQAQTLATLRDTLLPRLISGQLRLPEAEEQLAEAIA